MNIYCELCEATTLSETIIYSLKHSLYILPFLFLSYLLVEYLNTKHSQKINNLFNKDSKYGPLLGGLSGMVPQCGFSSTISTLYISKLVSIGTLFAVMIATSDEAMIILISNGQFKTLATLLSIKFILAVIVGFSVDLFFKNRIKEEALNDTKVENTCCSCCKKTNSFMKNVIIHTLNVFLFVAISSLVLELIVFYIGSERLESILLSGSIFQPVLASLIGLIPNCASSVLLTNLYITNNLSFASLLAGLISNAGVGMIVLFKDKKNIKRNLIIVFSLLTFSIIIGTIVQLLGVLS